MNLLDENFPADQAALLGEWKIVHRRIGIDLATPGIKDSEIIPLLHRLKRVTWFTQDEDFFRPRLSHPAYCLAWLDVKPGETASYVRRFLRHQEFNTKTKRMNTVVRIAREGIQFWRRRQPPKRHASWLA